MSGVAPAPFPHFSSPRAPNRWRLVVQWLRREQLLWRTVVCGALVLLSFGKVRLGPYDPGLFAALLGGYPYFWTALKGLRRLDTRVGFLVSVATVAALAIGEYYAAGHVVFIMMLGELIEERTLRRTERSFTELLEMFPREATVRRGETEETVRPEEVQPGETVVVRSGERVPVDGVVSAGAAAVDERHITGESLPKEAAPGAEVFAGSVTVDGYLEVEARQTGGQTSLAHMVWLLHQAQANRAPIAKAADRFTRWFAPAVLLIAGAVYFLTDDFARSLTILVVACPCAMCVATPTAVAAGLGAGARRGLLIKTGAAVEALGRVNAVLFDKTGTLTLGELQLSRVAVLPEETRSPAELVALAARAEGGSPHPVARALRREAGSPARSELTGFRSLPGGGVAAVVDGEEVMVGPRASLETAGLQDAGSGDVASLWEAAGANGAVSCGVAVSGSLKAVLSLVDGPRPGLAELMERLREDGVAKLEMLTGDRTAVAQRVAEGLGLDQVAAGLRPEDKVERVKALRAQGFRVAVVGDGVNDAPALAAGDVGLAMGGSGTALAAEASEVVLGGDALERLPEAFALGRRVLGVIKANLALSVVVNFVAILLSALGLVRPIGGALIHNAGSVAVVVHSASLLRWKPGVGRRRPAVSPKALRLAASLLLAVALVWGLTRSAEAHILPLVRNVTLHLGAVHDLGPLTPYTLPRDERAEEALSALYLVYDTLLLPDAEGGVRPWVADQVQWKDGHTLELQLSPKDRVQWQDNGEAVTPEDVATTVAVYQHFPHPIFTPIVRQIQKVEALGQDRVRLTVSGAPEAFLERLAQLPLLPAHLWQKVSEPEKVRQAVGCGPFRLTAYRPGEEYRLAGVETYYLAEHRAAELTVAIDRRPEALAESLLEGKLHTTLSPLAPELLARFTATLPRLRGFRIHEGRSGSFAYRATVFSDWHWEAATPLNRLSFLKVPVQGK